MSKYRVREQYGVFYVEKKLWLLGWATLCHFVGGSSLPKKHNTLEEAMEYIEQLDKDRTPVYHYPNQGKWKTKPPSDVKPVVAPPPPCPPKGPENVLVKELGLR